MAALLGGSRGQISQALADFPKRTKAQSIKNLRDAMKRVKAEVVLLLSRPGPPASLPGEPPRRRSGNLIRGIRDEVDEAKLVGQIRSTAPYSRALEKGTGRMAARPFLAVAWQRTKKDRDVIMQRRK